MKKNPYIIGINSGTSFDGIDVALVRFKGKSLSPIFIDGISIKYPRRIKEKIRMVINAGAIHELPQRTITSLDSHLGEIFSGAALKIIKKHKLKKEDILLIGSHGQTVYHKPRVKSVQLGDGKTIAKKTGIKTVYDFRTSDIKAGGEGAPLVPFLDHIVFNKSKNIKGILNIGGISNITIVGKNCTPTAFDIGPGNALIDLISKKYFNKDYDKDGLFAGKGEVYLKLIDRALKDKYFKAKPPKSTGKEYFNEKFIKKYFSKIKNKYDLIATTTCFSAECIEQALYDFVFPKYNLNELVISGGGLKNKALIYHLQSLLTDIRFSSSDQYDLPYQYKEAMLFALLGYTCHLGIPSNIPSCTGAKRKVVLGKITN
jgi:anhydro-N-acetylmuramic acid kinase